jgi:hypothetical protein
MEEILELNSNTLKREIHKKIKLYEDMILKNEEQGNENDLITYITLLFYETLPREFLHKTINKKNTENKKNDSSQNTLFSFLNQQNNKSFNTIFQNETNQTNQNKNNENQNENENENKINNSYPTISPEEKMKLKNMLKDPESYFEQYFENLFETIHQNENQLPLLKEKFSQILNIKQNEIQQKMTECNNLIHFFEELYIQKELQSKIPLTGIEKKKFILLKNDIIAFPNVYYGELFSRYLFSNLLQPDSSIQLSLPQTFYNSTIFENVDKSFSSWNGLLKYWLIYVLLVKNMFQKDAKIEDILHTDNLFQLSKKMRNFRKKKLFKIKHKNKKKKKHHRGGMNINEFEKQHQHEKQEKQKHHSQKNEQESKEAIQMKEQMKKMTYVDISHKRHSFWEFFNNPIYKENVGKFYEKKFHQNQNIQNEISCSTELPFFSNSTEKFKISSIACSSHNSFSHNEISFSTFQDKLEENLTIFQTLYAFNETNREDIEKFLHKVYIELIYLYLFILYKKKFIYIRYMNTFQQFVKSKNISISNQNKNQNQANNISHNQNKNQINQPNKNSIVNTLSNSQQTKYKNIQQKIQLLESRKQQLLRNRNQPNVDKKILIIDQYIRDLLLQKHNVLRP